jgi:isopenicillin N synthase-like dioxygenase
MNHNTNIKHLSNENNACIDRIPVVDLSGVVSLLAINDGYGTTTTIRSTTIQYQDYDERIQDVANQIINAFQTIGFVTLTNHGISLELIENTFKASQRFFTELSIETKMNYKYSSHVSNRGYIAMGTEQHANTSEPDRKETFDIGKEEEEEETVNEDEQSDSNKDKKVDTTVFKTPWPTEDDLPSDKFKNIMIQYYKALNRLNLLVMKLIGIGLMLDDTNFFVNQCNDQHCNLRLLHYPSLLRQDVTSQDNNNNNDGIIQRGAEHRDYGTITLLAQDMVGGLRVKRIDGTYTFVDPVPGSIIVNVGEMLQ